MYIKTVSASEMATSQFQEVVSLIQRDVWARISSAFDRLNVVLGFFRNFHTSVTHVPWYSLNSFSNFAV